MIAVRLLVLLALVVAPLAAEAQQAGKVYRVGFLGTDPVRIAHFVEAFRGGLRDAGWAEGQNVIIEYRWVRGRSESIPELSRELVRLPVDVLVAPTSAMAEVAKQATSVIPIVFVVHGDPVGSGHVASLARPGGNLTGLAQMQAEINSKGLELLSEAVPRLERAAVLWEPAIRSHAPILIAVEGLAARRGIKLHAVPVRTAADLDPAVSAIAREGNKALLVLAGTLAFTEARRLADLALKSRLPTMFTSRENAEAGGFLSYGANLSDLYRRAAQYVDELLKGAKPSELPVEQASRFEFIINLKTAKALGLTIPPSLLQRADQVIE